jgi:hypothetical protein
MKGTKVKHRADPTGRAMIVTSETVVAAAWIEGGEARSDHFEPEELEVVEEAGLRIETGVDWSSLFGDRGVVTTWVRDAAAPASSEASTKVDTDGTGNSFPDDPKPSDADLADAIESKLCLACDHWPPEQGPVGDDGVVCRANMVTCGPEDKCEKWIRAEPQPEDHEPQVGSPSAGEEIYPSGQRVPTRSEIETEDAAATLEAAGWFLISPEGHVTSLGVIKSGDPALVTIAEKCATLLVNQGWGLIAPADDVEHGGELTMPHPPTSLVAALREFETDKAGLVRRLTGEEDALRCEACALLNDEGDCLAGFTTGARMNPDHAKGCPSFDVSWRYTAGAIADWIEAQHGEAVEPDDAPPPADRYPCPSLEIKSATLGEQLAWLREHELPTPTGTGKADRTSRVLRALLAGIYTEEHADLLFGPLKCPVTPGPARCPECGSETPEDCEHDLP